VDPIVVPAPPPSSYNPNRPVSDLIKSQIKFFQHIELKRGDLGIDPKIAGNIHTEAGAAQYIAAVTHALRGKTPVTAAPLKLEIASRTKPAKKWAAGEPLSIATAASAATPARSKREVASKKKLASHRKKV
jgi:hypothetical protein